MRKSGLMKKAVVLGLTVAMALGTMVTANAADGKVWKYSFNNKNWNATLAGDWVQVISPYDAAVGYGLDEAYGWGAGITTKTASTKEGLGDIGVETEGVDDALLNAIGAGCSAFQGDTDVSFFVDLPAGTYDITVYAGGVSCNNTYDFNHIYIDGEEVVRDFATDPWNSDTKSGSSKLLTVDNLTWKRTITLTEAKKVEIKASNPADAERMWFSTQGGGGRAYMNAVVIEEVKADAPSTPATPSKDNVPKTGVVSTAAICGLVALAGAGVAVVTRKKED